MALHRTRTPGEAADSSSGAPRQCGYFLRYGCGIVHVWSANTHRRHLASVNKTARLTPSSRPSHPDPASPHTDPATRPSSRPPPRGHPGPHLSQNKSHEAPVSPREPTTTPRLPRPHTFSLRIDKWGKAHSHCARPPQTSASADPAPSEPDGPLRPCGLACPRRAGGALARCGRRSSRLGATRGENFCAGAGGWFGRRGLFSVFGEYYKKWCHEGGSCGEQAGDSRRGVGLEI